ncbi:hypothetical protein IWQ48_004719 [Labrenzia sp. EL_13]|nr:hypothetical protein [Labrenzia sp. EL_13]
MICSHKHRFIFIKTKKTASTTLEIGLAKLTGPEDIVTPIYSDGSKIKEGSIERPGQNYRLKLSEHGLRDYFSLVYNRHAKQKFGNHDSASRVRSLLGQELWDEYFTFTVVRNPFDQVVSMYFWDNRHKSAQERPSVFEWMVEKPWQINQTWQLCSSDGSWLLDDYIRLEDLEEDTTRICQRLGLSEDAVGLIIGQSMKTSQRPRSAKYQELLDERSKALIETLCHNEIEKFGYGF